MNKYTFSNVMSRKTMYSEGMTASASLNVSWLYLQIKLNDLQNKLCVMNVNSWTAIIIDEN